MCFTLLLVITIHPKMRTQSREGGNERSIRDNISKIACK